MNALKHPLFSILALSMAGTAWGDPGRSATDVVLVIHGGAGVPSRKKMTPELEKLYRAELDKALQKGYQALERQGGTSLDAVEAAIIVMEDSPLFNAGKGAVFTHDGRNELDAAIMAGADKKAGAVSGLTRFKNPISAARVVMEKSGHVMMVGAGAERFLLSQGLHEVSPVYFWTEERWRQLQEALREEEHPSGKKGADAASHADRHFGTVGAVARDRSGNLAAGTSTGGLTNKRPGRVGDTPIIGAGTYAENESCAVSATGQGELFIRFTVAHDIAALVKYKKLSVQDAATEVLGKLPKDPEGVGGVIVLDARGNCALPFNTEGMFRGYVTSDGKTHVMIYEK